MTDADDDYDLCVIGAGSGGLSVASAAAQLGAKVALFEKNKMGGDCLNYGCVPSKALIAAAKAARVHADSRKFGVAATSPSVDFSAVREHVRGVIATIEPHDSQERFEGLGVKVIRAAAAFRDARSIVADGRVFRARRFVAATGSSPAVPPIEGLDRTPHFTNETIFDNDVLPSRLVILGGGPIGAEMAQAHRRLGAEVVIVDSSRPLSRDDPELAEVVIEQFRDEGIEMVGDAKVSAIEKTADGVAMRVEVGGKESLVEGSHLLVAAGRRPNVGDLNLESAGIRVGRGGIEVDSSLRTSNRRVYAIGDVAGGYQFTHVAGYHAGLVIRNALFRLPIKADPDITPWVTYTDPELANVGLDESRARERYGDGIRVLRWSMDENDRAQAERRPRGKIKAIVGPRGRVVGAGIVGLNAGEMIGTWALAVSSRLKIKAMIDMIAPYPTLGEASRRAAVTYYADLAKSPMTRLAMKIAKAFG